MFTNSLRNNTKDVLFYVVNLIDRIKIQTLNNQEVSKNHKVRHENVESCAIAYKKMET